MMHCAITWLVMILAMVMLWSSSSCVDAWDGTIDNGRVVISVDDRDGSYTITIDHVVWFISAPTAFHVNNNWYIAKPAISRSSHVPADTLQLRLVAATTGQSGDIWGSFEWHRLQWLAGSLVIETEYRAYRNTPLLLFEQFFPSGANDTALGNTMNDFKRSITAFPRFSATGGRIPDLGSFYMNDQWLMEMRDVGLKKFIGGLYSGTPLLLHDRDTLRSVVLSPANNFKSSFTNIPADLNGDLCYGIHGRVRSLPRRFSQQTMMYISYGINNGMLQYGDLLLRRYGKQRYNPNSDDPARSGLSYFTDTGAHYWYNPLPGKNYQDTMRAIKEWHDRADLPVRVYELDSWWYYKSGGSKAEHGGIKLWEPRPDVFPDGFDYVQQMLGTPLITHSKYYGPDNDYISRYPFIIDRDVAIPTSVTFWNDLFMQAQRWGVTTWEQDWLETVLQQMNETNWDVDTARNFLVQMGQAAQNTGINIQYCMPVVSDILASVESGAVQSIRISGDYSTSTRQWQIGQASITGNPSIHMYYRDDDLFRHQCIIIAWALGLAPFKDVFWSVANQPNSTYKGFTEWNPELNSLVASMSTAGVAFGDAIDNSNRDIIMRTCMDDGTLFRTAKPATTIDTMFTNKRPASGEVWHTYTQIAGPESLSTSTKASSSSLVNFHYIMATNLSVSYSFTFNDFTTAVAGTKSYSSSDQFIAFEYSSPSRLVLFNSSQPLYIAPCAGTGERSPFALWIAAPLLSNGWTLLGENDKWLRVSSQRFIALTPNATTDYIISVAVHGIAGETITVRFADASMVTKGGDIKIWSIDCIFPGVPRPRPLPNMVAACTATGTCVCQ